jgi:hypothetical protein
MKAGKDIMISSHKLQKRDHEIIITFHSLFKISTRQTRSQASSTWLLCSFLYSRIGSLKILTQLQYVKNTNSGGNFHYETTLFKLKSSSLIEQTV